MDFSEVLKSRHMVRRYRPDPVDEEVLARVVRVIHRAPSAGYCWFDSGSLLTLLQLAAANEGLATGFSGPHEKGLRELLELPDDLGLSGVLTLGADA